MKLFTSITVFAITGITLFTFASASEASSFPTSVRGVQATIVAVSGIDTTSGDSHRRNESLQTGKPS